MGFLPARSAATIDPARTMRPWTFRVENIPARTTAKDLKRYFHTEDQPHIQVRSIVPAVDCEDLDGELTATISFQTWDETVTAPRVLDDTISVDGDFHGFTPLSHPKGHIAADIIAVTGLAAHAYGSWAHSPSNMWLRDYLPNDVANARVLIYGYPSQLQGSASSGILADHTNNFIHRLLSMRELTKCQDRPIVFIGHSLGCLIIKKALSDVNGSVGRYSSRLPVCAIVFFGAPHRGLQTTALETLVKSQPTEEMLRELRARSPTLIELNDRFRFVANDIDILTCVELWQTKTAVEMPDGSWKRKGKPEMMVYQDSAQLNFPKEKVVSCYADHGQIAKLKRGENGVYPDIKRAIKQALLLGAKEQVDVGLSRLQLQRGPKAIGEERSRHNENDMNESRPERPPFPAEESPLDDAQSQDSSIPGPPGKTADVLHDKDVLSTHSAPAFDDCENRAQVQNKQATSDPIITSHSTQVKSRDDEKLHEGVIEPLKVSIPCAKDRWNALTSSKEKKSHDKTVSRAKKPFLRPQLCFSSQVGDVEKVRSLLAQGSSIHESTEDLVDHKRDAFLLAALHGRLEVLKLLIQHNCDVSKRDLKGRTALHLICCDPEIKPKQVIESLVILLLEHGVPLEAKSLIGDTALILSAYYGKISIAECVLDCGADIHCADNEGSTALHLASQKGYHEIASLLLLKGANIHAAGNVGYTALHWAAQEGHPEVVALLISKGADISSTDKYGWTAQHCAAEKGHPEVVALLISKGADVSSTDNYGWTALHRAAHMDCHEVVALLISEGADISSTDNYGWTALHRAAHMDCHEVVALLISEGASLEALTKNDLFTPLHISGRAKSVSGKSARLLLKAGADKEAASGFKSMRALHLAAQQGNIEVLNELLAFGVEIDVGDRDKRCALHWAKSMGQWRNIEALLAKGANPLLRDKYDDQPSRIVWRSDPNISPEDKEKCLKLLHDAEKVWKVKERQEKGEAKRKPKESGGSRFSRNFGKIN